MRTYAMKRVLTIALPIVAVACGHETSFEKDVMPILQANCIECHDVNGEGLERSGFNVSSYASLMKGTKFGPVVVAGDSASSTLYRLISHKTNKKIQMPPHHDEALAKGRIKPLEQDEIDLIKGWIDEGAVNN